MKALLRGAIVGFGFIAERGHAAAYRARAGGVEIVAVADPCAARRRVAAGLFPEARVYDGHDELLAKEAGRLDFVDVAAPPSEHAALAGAALRRGLHVLCEKPLATSARDARAMVDLARRARRVLYPCHSYKHAPMIRAVDDLIAAGALGPVHRVTLETLRHTHARGTPEWRPDWRRESRYAGGGIAMDHGVHAFYLAFAWLASYPTAVAARTSILPPATTPAAFDTEDDLRCTLRFPGGEASLHLTWRAAGRKVRYLIEGARGTIRVEDDTLDVCLGGGNGDGDGGLEATDREQERRVQRLQVPSRWEDPSHAGWFGALLGGFRAAVARGDWVGRDAEEACLSVDLVEAAYRSAREGSRMIALDRGDHHRPLSRHGSDQQREP
jgi:predicted dehydrogenase